MVKAYEYDKEQIEGSAENAKNDLQGLGKDSKRIVMQCSTE